MKIVHQRGYYRSKISKKSPKRSPYRYRYSSSRRYSSPVSKRTNSTYRRSSSQRHSKKRKVSRLESVVSRKSRASRKIRKRRRRRTKSQIEEDERARESGHEDRAKTFSENVPEPGNELTPAAEEVSQEVQPTHEINTEDCVAMEEAEAEAVEPEVEESLEPVVIDRGNEVSGPIEI